MRMTKGEKIFGVINYILLALLALITIYPLYDVLRISFCTPAEAATSAISFFPKQWSIEAYKHVMQNEYIWIGYQNTIIRILVGVTVSMVIMIGGAYALSKKKFPHRGFWTGVVVFTMFFQGGMVPSYLLVKNLGINDTIWALILPRAIDTFGMLILRNSFMSLPDSLEESAYLDGANVYTILIRIIVPLSLPTLMTIGMWVVVFHWNAWFDCLIYIRDTNKYVLQAVLRKIVIDSTAQFDITTATQMDYASKQSSDVVKCATIVVATLPILAVYPFIQKYFVKGVMVGSLKG